MRPSNNDHGSGFDRQLDELLAFVGARPLDRRDPLAAFGPGRPARGCHPFSCSARPRGQRRPPPAWASDTDFAAYTNTNAVADALQPAVRQFTPARPGDRPHAILGLKVIVGQDDEHAKALALPWQLALVLHRAGNPAPLMNVEDALRHRWSEAERAAEAKIDRHADIVGRVPVN